MPPVMPLLFATRKYQYLLKALQMHTKGDRYVEGQLYSQTFPDGEYYQRICQNVRGRPVVIVGGTTDEVDTLEIYDLACAIAKYGASSITMVVPYYGYSTMERATREWEVVKAKTRARLFSSIPNCPHGNQIILLDLHVDGITHYFEGNIQPVHISADVVIREACEDIYQAVSGDDGPPSYVLASTDAGRAKKVEILANRWGQEHAFITKRRINGSETEVTNVSADVEGRHVIMYDDMVRSGSSLVKASVAYRKLGARTVSAISVHGVFTSAIPHEGLAAKRDAVAASLYNLDKVVVTNSHPNSLIYYPSEASDRIQVRCIARVIEEALKQEIPR